MSAVLSQIEHDNRRFVARLLHAYLQANLIPPTFTRDQFRDALAQHGIIPGGAEIGR